VRFDVAPLIDDGLALALENNLIGPAADAYQRLASVHEQAGDYVGAREAYQSAFEFCDAKSVSVFAQFCLACLAVVLRDTGEWDRAITVCKQVLDSPQTNAPTRAIAGGLLGLVYAYRGQTKHARSPLRESFDLTQRFEMALMTIWAVWGLAHLDEVLGDTDSAIERCRFLLNHCQHIEDRHYAVPALCWAATFFASHDLPADARACAHALSIIASSSGTPGALAALAHALGETALLDGNAKLAAEQFSQALTILGEQDLPYERALTQWRAGVALVACGERALGIERLTDAYRTAIKLKAKPLADRVARELAALGEKVDKRLGRRAARNLEHGGLTLREREVLRRMALGRTNREIAEELFLSPRTVDMFVRNILNKLNCSSRFEASRKAEELSLLV
jgi:ATP/maltotriose-dependent transcriptional regulator MalT